MLRHLVVLFLHKISIVTNYLIIIIYCKCKHDFGGSLTDSWISVNPWSEVICLRRVYTILCRSWIVIVSGLNTSNKWCYRDFDSVFERTANFSTQWCARYEKLRFSDFQKSSLSVYCLSMLCTRCVEVNTIFFFYLEYYDFHWFIALSRFWSHAPWWKNMHEEGYNHLWLGVYK